METLGTRLWNETYPQILAYQRENPMWMDQLSASTPVLRAEVIHAIRSEMACTLADVVQRRLPIGAAGPPPQEILYACAQLMAARA